MYLFMAIGKFGNGLVNSTNLKILMDILVFALEALFHLSVALRETIPLLNLRSKWLYYLYKNNLLFVENLGLLPNTQLFV